MTLQQGQSMDQKQLDWTKFLQTAPAVVTSMRALTKAVADSGLEKSLLELTRVRASQLNGCAFCLSLHVDLARTAGVSQQLLDLLPTWREAGVFTEREQAALAWTEALTFIGQQDLADDLYRQVFAHFSVPEVAFLTASIAHINAWNRIAGGLRFAPGPLS